jgi:alpha-galactosidase/6-phospho-beta-glucosidase family protein
VAIVGAGSVEFTRNIVADLRRGRTSTSEPEIALRDSTSQRSTRTERVPDYPCTFALAGPRSSPCGPDYAEN